MKKILLLFFVLLFLFLLPAKSFAQTTTTNQNADNSNISQQIPKSAYPLNTDSNVPQNFHTYTQVVFLELLSSISCQLSGINPLDPQGQCLGASGKGGKIGFVSKGGAIGFLGNGISDMYNIPVSTSQYISYEVSHFGIARTADASNGSGSGFESLLPFLPIWTAFRNITYLLFVLVFILIGLGIMFRVKIDPRSVMTIQNAIPKIIIALILITFSYAIVGFLIDLMRVSIYLIYGVMAGIPHTDVSQLTPSKIQGSNPFTAANALADNKAGLAAIASNVTGVIVGSVKDALGLGPNGGPSIGNLPVIHGIGDIFSGIIKHIPVLGGLKSVLSKIPFIGDLFNGLSNIAGGVVSGSTNMSFANYLVHAISVASGILMGLKVGTLSSNAPGGGFQVQASFLGIGGGGGFTIIPGFLMGWPIGTIVGTATTAFTEVLLRELLPNLIAFFIVMVALFTAMFRLWFQLIKAYIYLFLYIVLAPFFIATGIIPGFGSGFGGWLKSVIANLAVFPTTYIMLLLGKVLIDSVNNSKGSVFVPPLVGDFSHSAGGFAALLGLGILLLTPEVVNLVHSAIKAPEMKFGAAMGRALNTGQGFVSAPIRGGWGSLVGENRNGTPKPLTDFARRHGGILGGAIFGGGFSAHMPGEDDGHGNPVRTPIARFPGAGRLRRVAGRILRNTPRPPRRTAPPPPGATGITAPPNTAGADVTPPPSPITEAREDNTPPLITQRGAEPSEDEVNEQMIRNVGGEEMLESLSPEDIERRKNEAREDLRHERGLS